jgi:hypothetical protein
MFIGMREVFFTASTADESNPFAVALAAITLYIVLLGLLMRIAPHPHQLKLEALAIAHRTAVSVGQIAQVSGLIW